MACYASGHASESRLNTDGGSSLGVAIRRAKRVLLRRRGPTTQRPVSQYIDFKGTLAAAAEQGLSVGDYIDQRYNQPGVTHETMDKLAELGAFAGVDRVCEIGPGSGRYLAETIRRCNPSHYEIYETATDWRDWLVATYGVVANKPDLRTMAATPSASIDLVQAHKVFTTIAPVPSIRYLLEMQRIVRSGGRVAFDAVTEDCLDRQTIENWVVSGSDYETHPSFIPKKVVLDLFEQGRFSLVGSFIEPMEPGTTCCFIFQKPDAG